MGRARLIRVVIVVSVLAVFGRVCFHEFTWWDDAPTIHQNPLLNPPSLRGIGLYWTAIGPSAPMGLYVPVTYSAWGALARLSYLHTADDADIRLNPWIFHSASVLLHAAAALVVFWILRKIVSQDWPAAAGALLWALHPVQVEPVAWASGMKDVLGGLLTLLAAQQFLQSFKSGARSYAAAVVLMILAMLSKPTAMITPMLAVVLAIAVGVSRRQALRRAIPFFLLAIPCIIWTKWSQPTTGMPVAPLVARPLLAMDALAFYLGKLVLPIDLTVDHGRSPLRVLAEGWAYFTWIVPAAFGLSVLLSRRRSATISWAAAVFVIGVAPVLGFVPFMFQYHSGVAEHYLYISMLGPAMAAAWAISIRPNRLVGAITAAALLLLAARSIHQAGFWFDDLTLWQHNVQVNPQSFLAQNNLGAELIRRGQLQAAERALRRAIDLKPDYATAHDNLAMVLAQTGRVDQAIEHIAEVLRISGTMPPALRPRLDDAHNLLGLVLMSQGRFSQAIEHFQAALTLNSGHPSARKNLDAATAQAARPVTRPQ